ncbi:TrkA family potassium uptake protein [Candidatus Sumerlaeota bacterium]|nr:TrkA family potassium uptake protein [Candidatus Sumerlaeota bacterium]
MKRYIIIGVGQFGYSVAKTLVDMGCDVLAIDLDENRVQQISDQIPHAVAASGIDEKSLRSLSAQEFDVAIVSCGESLESSILSTVILKDLGVKEIIVKALNPIHGDILRRVGANQIVYPETEMGEQLAHRLVNPDILQEIALSREYSIKELTIPHDLVEKSILEGNIRARHGLTILAIRHHEGEQKESDQDLLVLSPPPSYIFKEGDRVLLFGKNKDIENFRSSK